MNPRTAVAVAGLALAVTGSPAVAAPGVACRLLTDPAGDGKVGPTGRDTPAYAVLPNDPSLDVLGADVASGPDAVTVVVRLAGYDPLDPTALPGRLYRATVTVAGAPWLYQLALLERPGALPVATVATVRPGSPNPTVEGQARFAVDRVHSEIRLWIPLAYYRSMALVEPFASLVALGRRGRTVTRLEVTTDRWYGDGTGTANRAFRPPPQLVPLPTDVSATGRADDAVARIGYASATPSCVHTDPRSVSPATSACPLVTDVLGDDSLGLSLAGSPYDDGNLDLTGGDVATDPRTLAVAARVVWLDDRDRASPLGRAYLVEFDANWPVRLRTARGWTTVTYGTAHLFLSYVDRSDGPPRTEWGALVNGFGYMTIGAARATFDVKRHQVRIWVPLTAHQSLRRLGDRDAVVGNLRVRSYRYAGDPTGTTDQAFTAGYVSNPNLLVEVDEAIGDAVYRGGTRSCLPIGR